MLKDGVKIFDMMGGNEFPKRGQMFENWLLADTLFRATELPDKTFKVCIPESKVREVNKVINYFRMENVTVDTPGTRIATGLSVSEIIIDEGPIPDLSYMDWAFKSAIMQ